MQINYYLRKIIPAALRTSLKLALRSWADYRNRHTQKFAKIEEAKEYNFSHSLEIQQPVMPGETLQAKLANIQIGIDTVEKIVIQPHEILSFWHIIGNTTPKKGYQKGRNLINGKLQVDYGGGLCQLASIMYHLAISANLTILERHHHSVDIYEEHERFTPLGADATVVYGYKDLRFENPYSFPIAFKFSLSRDLLIGQIISPQPLTPQQLDFKRFPQSDSEIKVKTVNQANEIVAISVYKR